MDSESSHHDDDDVDKKRKKKEKKEKKKEKKEKKEKKKEKKEKKRKKSVEEGNASTTSNNSSAALPATKKKKNQHSDELLEKDLHQENAMNDPSKSAKEQSQSQTPQHPKYCTDDDKIVESSHFGVSVPTENQARSTSNNVSLLLFYQYVEPPWSNDMYKEVLSYVEKLGIRLGLTGRMRVAKEGLNCTLTADMEATFRFCKALRTYKPNCFTDTEFKVTHHLPVAQRFGQLKIMPVTELVNYGLQGSKAPPIQQYSGTHLEPLQYHQKIAENNTVIIDVRNHYEAAIGHFEPPPESTTTITTAAGTAPPPPVWLNPKMRKSTEFPAWLDDPATKEQLQGKQVLMYCTGGIRCERASALVRDLQVMDTYMSCGVNGLRASSQQRQQPLTIQSYSFRHSLLFIHSSNTKWRPTQQPKT